MESFVPLSSESTNSSLWDEKDHVFKVFMTMLAKKGRDHIVRLTVYALARESRKTEEEVQDALKVLAEPDTRRHQQKFEGRRIRWVDDEFGGGWLVLNGEYYQKQMQLLFKRAGNARRQREWRERHKMGGNGPLPGEAEHDRIAKQQGETAADQYVDRREFINSQSEKL